MLRRHSRQAFCHSAFLVSTKAFVCCSTAAHVPTVLCLAESDVEASGSKRQWQSRFFVLTQSGLTGWLDLHEDVKTPSGKGSQEPLFPHANSEAHHFTCTQTRQHPLRLVVCLSVSIPFSSIKTIGEAKSTRFTLEVSIFALPRL
jgi:hypothetical protein